MVLHSPTVACDYGIKSSFICSIRGFNGQLNANIHSFTTSLRTHSNKKTGIYECLDTYLPTYGMKGFSFHPTVKNINNSVGVAKMVNVSVKSLNSLHITMPFDELFILLIEYTREKQKRKIRSFNRGKCHGNGACRVYCSSI